MADPNLTYSRARRARAGRRLGKTGYGLLLAVALLSFVGGAALLAGHVSYGYSVLGLGLAFLMPAIWWKRDLSVVPVGESDLDGRLSAEVLALLRPRIEYNPQSLWELLRTHWQAVFFSNHLLIPSAVTAQQLSHDSARLDGVWQKAISYADATASSAIEPGHLTAALIATAPGMQDVLNSQKLTQADVDGLMAWLGRDLAAMRREKPRFGGLGRDWASGFTPQLNRFGHNISLGIEQYGANFGALTDSQGVRAIKAAFSQGAAAVALIGPDGIGKTMSAYALAQNLLAESRDRRLEHHQIIGLDPTSIISTAKRPGDLEQIISILLAEAAHAGNIMLFLDDAEVFFHEGTGSFDVTQILLPAIQSRAIQFVMAMTPHDFQQLKSTNSTFAGMLMPVILQEPDEAGIMEVLADNATRFELQHQLIITYAALKEAYRLSGRYDQDLAYPGKAVRLLEQALSHAEQGFVTAGSIQAAIEQSTGVKAGTAAPIEADELLNLEAKIHERMINQSRAVSVVANALRRARAGVANPKRPIGSFLFLGPTGVGKTELAKSIAATYFGDEQRMIRLDMSEYQQESDVSRILSTGQGEATSLIMEIRKQPFSVVLLDEIEKAHPNILNLLLQLLDEGQLTDASGRATSFKDAIIITTSNAGANEIRTRIDKGETLESFEEQFIDGLIDSGQFKPELLNRFDEIVLFRPLNEEELGQIVRLMLAGINQTLANQNIAVELTDAAVQKIVAVGNDPRLGARPMRRALQRAVEDTVAQKILKGEAKPGDHLTLDAGDLTI